MRGAHAEEQGSEWKGVEGVVTGGKGRGERWCMSYSGRRTGHASLQCVTTPTSSLPLSPSVQSPQHLLRSPSSLLLSSRCRGLSFSARMERRRDQEGREGGRKSAREEGRKERSQGGREGGLLEGGGGAIL